MQKKILFTLLFLVLSFALVSCSSDDDDSASPSQQGQGQEPPAPSVDDKVSVSFDNRSAYAVHVFVNAHRKLGGSVLVTVPAGDRTTANLSPSQTASGDVFYFEYIIPIGSVDFPYFSFNNSKVAVIASGKTNTVTIDELTSCPTKSSYLVIENQTTSTAYLQNSNSILTPESQESYYIESGAGGVFLLGQNNEDIYYRNTAMLKVSVGTQYVSLPDISFELGNVYVVTVTNDGASLKSVSPFDVDTQKQIWSFDDTNFVASELIRPVLRESYDSSNGSLVMGTLCSDKTAVALMEVDVYGNKILPAEGLHLSHSAGVTVTQSEVLDFVEQSDGSFVILLQNLYTEENETTVHIVQFLVCYNFETRILKWSHIFEDLVLFRSDSKNKLLRLADDECVLAGGLLENGKMHRYVALVDARSSVVTATQYVSSEYTNYYTEEEVGVQTMFTSIYYNGVNFYACGYDNCDFDYSDRVHTGIVYEFSSDFSTYKKIYEKDRCLFLCIDGIGSDYYICGELCDSGNILKGCYLSSAMIAAEKLPVAYFVQKKSHCWFNQLCYYDGKIVLCGKAGANFSGTEATMAFVVAFSITDKLLWENTSFADYTDAVSLIPNEIGTYIIQLLGIAENSVYYVSADLLGNEKK